MTFGISRGVAVDAAGNVQAGVWVEVRRMAPGFPLQPQLYEDAEGTVGLSNPFYSVSGEFAFYCVGGTYRVTVTKPGFSKQWHDVPVSTAQAADVDAYATAGFTWAPESATGSPPATGCIRANNADWTAATILRVNKTTLGGSAVATWLQALAAGDDLYLATGVGVELGWTVVSVTNQTNHVDIQVSTYVGPVGPVSLGDSGFVTLGKGRKGAAGTNGSNGANGVDGAGLFSRVRAVSTSNITISTALNNGDSIDGVTLATNDLVLVVGQSAPAQNGVYVVGVTPVRDTAFDTYDEHPGAYVSVMEGSANADTLWRCTSDKGGTLGTTAINFTQFQAGVTSVNGQTGAVSLAIREKLSANRTYYVRTDGSDSNSGLANTSGGAFLTIAKAIAVALSLDAGASGVEIVVGAGTWTTPVSIDRALVGGGLLQLTGDTTTPANVTLSTTGSTALSVTGGAKVAIGGFRIQTTTSGNGIDVNGAGSTVTINGNMTFGAIGGGFSHLHTAYGGGITIGANYTITGGAGRHWWTETFGSFISAVSRTITLTGTPAFSVAFAAAELGSGIVSASNTFSGSATGVRYAVATNSVIATFGGGASALPGNSAGTTATGGQYT